MRVDYRDGWWVIGMLIAVAVVAIFVPAAMVSTVWWWVVLLGLLAWTRASEIPDAAWMIAGGGLAICWWLGQVERSRRLQAARHAEVLERLRRLETAIAALQEKRWDDLAADEED